MERLVLAVHLRVFIKPEDEFEHVRNGFLRLVPFALADEKVELKEETIDTSMEGPARIVRVLRITLTKPRHVTLFLEHLNEKLSAEDKRMLLNQKESRLDEEGLFFLRLERIAWMVDSEAVVTDSGNCYHIALDIAAYPKKRETMLAQLEKVFMQSGGQ